LRKAGIFSRVDDSNTSIGKRYARNDELGTPFGVTLDFACEHSFTSTADPANSNSTTNSCPEPDDDSPVRLWRSAADGPLLSGDCLTNFTLFMQ
jgi:glycyl-tRNA synthetase